MTSRVAVATCAAVPTLDDDGPLLLAALADAGVRATVVVWDDPAVVWSDFDVVLIRSTWDYPLRRAEFLAFLDGCRRTANPGDVIAWNTDKHYLSDLERAGVATVPTDFLPPGAPFVAPDHPFVVKPTISCSAADTARFVAGEGDPARALVDTIHAQGRTAMVQPYLQAVDTDGETSLVFLGGVLSHAVRRAPVLSGATGRRTDPDSGGAEAARRAQPTSDQLTVAAAALAAVPAGADRLSYARVDLIPGPDGPVLLELELTEPFLFLSFAPPHLLGGLLSHLLRDR